MDFELTPEQKAIEDRCRDFANEEIAPRIKSLEEDVELRLNLFRKMAKLGLFLLVLPKDKGGASVGMVGYLAGLKAIAKVDAGIAVAMAVTNMVAEAIAIFGTEQQKAKYLPKIGSGLCVPLSFALTEKQAGSDVKSITTSVRDDPQDNRYLILSGEKQFITNADIAGALVVMAREESGISAFLIDRDTPGLAVTKKENKLGLLTANLVSLKFDNCRIPKESLLGTPGNGLKIALNSLDSGRIGIAAQAIGIAEAAFEAAIAFSKQRQQFGHPICENQAIAFQLADMHVKLNAATWMMYRAAALKDRGLPFTLEAAEAKLFCSEISNEIVAAALQIHGGYGYIKDYPAEKYFRDARVTTLYEGTSEIQRLVISRQILK